MGNFSNNTITDVGRMLLADVQAGAVFTPTRIVMGSGSLPGGATTQGITEVITPVKSLAINKIRRTPDGKCVFGGVYTNEEVTEPFYFRELALYAKAVYHNEDGSVKSEGVETLYSYGNAGATADYMPAYSTSTVVEKQMDLVVWVGNDIQVDLTIESEVYITHEDFDSHAGRHAIGGEDPITPASIGAAPDGYGLGELSISLSAADNLNNITQNGWYSWRLEMPTNAPYAWGNMLVTSQNGRYAQTVMVFPLGCVIQRTCIDNKWGEWEWVNPPYTVGIEYRTTERRNGTAVFKKLDADGVLKYRLLGSALWIPCAQEYGAVQKNGDIMTGDLTIEKAIAAVKLNTPNGIGSLFKNANATNDLGTTISDETKDGVTDRINLSAARTLAEKLRLVVAGEKIYNVLHTGNKELIKPADIGAVNKAGDTMTGELTIKKNLGPAFILAEEAGPAAGAQLYNNTLLLFSRNNIGDLNNYRLLSVANSNEIGDVAYAIGLSDVINGVAHYYNVLHTGNLATYGLGAVAASVE